MSVGGVGREHPTTTLQDDTCLWGKVSYVTSRQVKWGKRKVRGKVSVGGVGREHPTTTLQDDTCPWGKVSYVKLRKERGR